MGVGVETVENLPTASEGGYWDRDSLLAHARVAVALACAIAVYLNPRFLGKHTLLSEILILLYLTYGAFNLAMARVHRYPGLTWALSLHISEVVITSFIIMVTGGAQSPFLGLYLFVLLVAAWKWGFNGSLVTACICMILLFSNLTVPSSWFSRAPRLASGATAVAMMALSATLISLACFLGLLVERENKRFGDMVIITRLVRSALPEPSLRLTIEKTLAAVREHFEADRVRLALQEIRGEQAVAWEVRSPVGETGKGIQFWKLTESTRRASFAMPPEGVRRWLEPSRLGDDDKLTMGGSRPQGETPGPVLSGLSRFSAMFQEADQLYDLHIVSEQHSLGSWRLLATSFSFEGKWLGRLTVYNPRRSRGPSADSRFLGALVREVGPAVYGKYLVGRLRSRVQAMERARLARDLHDGVIQSLMALELQIDLLRRTQTASWNPAHLLEELSRVQELLHNEIANVREEMQRKKPLDVEPHRLMACMAETVERFRRDQGISASFVADSQEVSLPSRACTEVVRILQEGLANIRKHSGARTVGVRFCPEGRKWKLTISDDGRGFGFTGRRSSEELEASFMCPLVIKERVSAIGGELFYAFGLFKFSALSAILDQVQHFFL